MEKFISCIQLTPNQAKKVIKKYYPIHLDFNCPIEDRYKMNDDFVKHDIYAKQKKALFNILTSPVNTVFEITCKRTVMGVGFTTIKPENDYNNQITGFKNESCEHIEIAQTFFRAKSFGWFKSKYPL